MKKNKEINNLIDIHIDICTALAFAVRKNESRRSQFVLRHEIKIINFVKIFLKISFNFRNN